MLDKADLTSQLSQDIRNMLAISNPLEADISSGIVSSQASEVASINGLAQHSSKLLDDIGKIRKDIKTQVRLGIEATASGKKNYRLTIGVFVVAIVVPFTTVLFTTYQTGKSSEAKGQYTTEITAGLDKIEQAVLDMNKSKQNDIATLLAEQARIIDQLEQQRNADRQTIEHMKVRLADIEAKYESLNVSQETIPNGDK